MKLTELDPKFLTKPDAEGIMHFVDSIQQGDGLEFLCPVCFKANNGPIGTHSIICWQPHVPQSVSPGPGRWKFEGTGFSDISLVAGSSSIFLNGPGCGAHFFIKNGEIA